MMETREIQDGTKEEVPNEGSCDCSTGVNKDSGSLFLSIPSIRLQHMKSEGRRLVPLKMPRSLRLSMGHDEDLTYSPAGHHIRYRIKNEGTASLDRLEYESNTNLVQWSDGSWTLVVDDIYYECRIQYGKSYLVEASDPKTLICSTVAPHTLGVRSLSLSVNTKTTSVERTKKSTQLRPFENIDLSMPNRTLNIDDTSLFTHENKIIYNPKPSQVLDAKFLEDDIQLSTPYL